MTKRVQRYGETSGTLASLIGLAREIIVNTTKWTLTVHDGTTEGGYELALADASNIDVATSSDKGLMSAADKAKLDDYPTLDSDPLPVANGGTGGATQTAALQGLGLTGVVVPYAGATAPDWGLFCDGSAVSRTTYSDLFAVIGTQYGTGDGSTTFNLPNIAGRVIAGKESSASKLTSAVSGVDGATLGATGGNQAMHGHTHTATTGNDTPDHTHTYDKSSGSVVATSGGSQGFPTTTTSTASGGASARHTHSVTVETAGAGSSQNVQPTIVLNMVIVI